MLARGARIIHKPFGETFMMQGVLYVSMAENTNADAVAFDDVYSPAKDDNDSRAIARAVLIAAKHKRPDTFKTLKD